MALENFEIEVVGTGADAESAYADLLQNIWKVTYNEYATLTPYGWLNEAEIISDSWLNGTPIGGGDPYGWEFLNNLEATTIEHPDYETIFTNAQQVGDVETSEIYWADNTIVTYKFTVNVAAWRDFLASILPAGGQQAIGLLNTLVVLNYSGASTSAGAQIVIDLDTPVSAAEADVQDDTTLPLEELLKVPPTESGESAVEIKEQMDQDAAVIEIASTDPEIPAKKMVFLDPSKYAATHVIFRDDNRPDKTRLRSKPEFKGAKAKPWIRLKNYTLVKVLKQNVGKGGKFHEVLVKSGEFAGDYGASNKVWPLATEVNKGFVKISYIRPLKEGLLLPIKEVNSNTDIRQGQADSVPSEWRKRELDLPILVTKQNAPWESTYEVVLRTKKSNFLPFTEEEFLRKYKIIGILKILRHYNKAFKSPAPSEERMAELLADTSFCEDALWHLDTTTKNSKILVCIKVLAKFLDRYPTKMETFDFDKVREGDENRIVDDVQNTGVSGTQKQALAAAISAAAKIELGIPDTSAPGLTKIIDFVPSFSLACKYGDLKSNIGTLKEMLTYYESLMKGDKENRIAVFPNGPIRGPLDFKKEIKNLDTWQGALKNFLNNNEYEYQGEPCAPGTQATTPKNAADADILEFGWNSRYQLIYVLFNGFPLRIGIKYFAERSAFRFSRTNHFIHNSFDVEGDNTAKQSAAIAPDETAPSEPPDEISILKHGTVSEFKQQPEKRKPWTEWILAHIYRGAIIRPSESKGENHNKTIAETKEQEFGEGPYTQEEVDIQEKKEAKTEDKVEMNQEAERSTFETMDAFIQDAGNIVEKIEELEDAFYFLLDKVGLRPLVDSLMACLMKQVPSAEEMLASIGLKSIFKDVRKAIQFIGDILNSAPVECAMLVLHQALELVYEEHPQQEAPLEETAAIDTVAEDVAETADLDASELEENRIVAARVSSLKTFYSTEQELKDNHSINYIFKNDKLTVKAWQQHLINQGAYAAADVGFDDNEQVDGIFGSKTEAATMEQIPEGYVPSTDDPTTEPDPAPQKFVLKKDLDAATASMPGPAESAAEAAAAGSDPNNIIMKNGSKDKKSGLKNHVTVWQRFLASEGFLLMNENDENYIQGPRRWTGADADGDAQSHNIGLPNGNGLGTLGIKEASSGKYRFYYIKDGETKNTKFGIDGIFGWRTTAATKNWLTWLRDHGAGYAAEGEDATDAMTQPAATGPWAAIDASAAEYDGEVTQAMYNLASSFLEHKSQSKEANTEIDSLAEVDIANRVKFLGPRPPAGYYCRLGAPGPCDEIYSKIVKISRKLAIKEMMPTSTDLGPLIKKQSDLKIEYVNCMKSAEEEPVIGEGLDHFSGKEKTENDQEKELATTIVVAEGTCDGKRTNLVNALNGSTIWPGDVASAAQHDALKAYIECVNKEITDKRQKLLESGGVALSGVTSIHPFPQTLEEAWEQFRIEGRFPTNVRLRKGFDPQTLYKIFSNDQGPCQELIDLLMNALLQHVPPATMEVLNRLIQTAGAGAFDGVMPSLPDIPTLPDSSIIGEMTAPTYDPEGMLQEMIERLVRKILTEIIITLVKVLVRMINEACAENDGAAEDFGGITASDIFSGMAPADATIGIKIPDFEDLQNRLNKLQNAVNDWGLPFDVVPGGSLASPTGVGLAPGDAISYWDVLDALSKILKPSQLCNLFDGDSSIVIMAAVREFLDENFEEVSALLPTQEDLKDFFMLLGKYADPSLCKEIRQGKWADPVYIPGGKVCVPDLIKQRLLAQCTEAGLTQEQCTEMQERHKNDTITNIAKLANWPPNVSNARGAGHGDLGIDTLPDLCTEIAEMKTNMPSVVALLDSVLGGLMDSVIMIFNGETGYFVPALMYDTHIIGVGEVPEGFEDLPLLIGQATGADTSSQEVIAQICKGFEVDEGLLANLASMDWEKVLDLVKGAPIPEFFKKTKKYAKIFKSGDGGMGPYDRDENEFPKSSAGTVTMTEEKLTEWKELVGPGTDEQFVAPSVRAHLRSPTSFSTDIAKATTTFLVPRMTKEFIKYTLPDIDMLVDSYKIRIDEDGDKLFFKNTKFINELVQAYVKSEFEDWPAPIGEPGPFAGDNPPQIILFHHILDKKFLESGIITQTQVDGLHDEMNQIYHSIKDAIIYKIRNKISYSRLFEKSEIQKLKLTPSTKDAKDECGIPLMLQGDIDVASLLDPKKYLEDAKKSYTDAVMEECETGPAGTDEEGPLEQAVTEMVVRALLRTFAIESSLNSIFVLSEFHAKDCLDEKVMLGYTMRTFKKDMMERKIYSRTKEVAKRIIRKRRKNGDIDVPASLRTGHDCLIFLLREEIKDVNMEFEKILGEVVDYSNNKFPSWEGTRFSNLLVLGGSQKEHIGIYPYDLAMGHGLAPGAMGDLDPNLPKLWTDVPNNWGYDGVNHVTWAQNRFGTVIDHKSLGFPSLETAQDYYGESLKGGINVEGHFAHVVKGISLRDVLIKHGTFIWEPYLKVDEAIYEQSPASGGAHSESISYAHSKFLQGLLNIDFVKVAGGSDGEPHEFVYDKFTNFDFKWNAGLSGYTNIDRFGLFLGRIQLHINKFNAYLSTWQQLEGAGGDIILMAPPYEYDSSGPSDVLPIDWNADSWPICLPGGENTSANDILSMLNQELGAFGSGTDKVISKQDFIDWWSLFEGPEKAENSWKTFSTLIKALEVSNEYYWVQTYTPSTEGGYGPVGVNPSISNSWFEEGAQGGSVKWTWMAATTVAGDVLGPGGQHDQQPNPTSLHVDNIIKLLNFQIEGVNYARVWPEWLDGSGAETPKGGLFGQAVQAEGQTLGWDLTDQHAQNLCTKSLPAADPLGFFGDPKGHVAGTSADWSSTTDIDCYKMIEPHGNLPTETQCDGHPAGATWDSATSTCAYGWTATALDLLNHVLKYVKFLGDYEGSLIVTNADVEHDGDVADEMSQALLSIHNHSNTTFNNMITNLGYFNSIHWGLRLSYVFNEDTPNMDQIKDMLYSVHENYNADAVDMKLHYADGDITNQDDVIEGLRNWPFGLSQNVSDDPGSPGAPKFHYVEYDHEPIHNQLGTTPKKIYTIPLFEAEKDLLQTSMFGKTIMDWNGGGMLAFTGEKLKSIYYEEAFEDLKQQIISKEEYAALFDYALPVKRYLSINTINVIMAMKKIGPGPLMYTGTRDILTSILLSAQDGVSGPDNIKSIGYKDPQLAGLGGTAGSFSDSINAGEMAGGYQPKEINIAAMAIKMFFQTPLMIFKSLVERFDPNISTIKSITDNLKVAMAELPTTPPACVVEAEYDKQMVEWQALSDELKEVTPAPFYAGIADEFSSKFVDIRKKLKDNLDGLPIPLISFLSYPNILPFGIGFPPEPWGPGVGPPLSPLGLIYLALGLYKDGQLFITPDMGKRKKGGSTLAEQSLLDQGLGSDSFSAECKQKRAKYRQAIIRGMALDAEPDEEDTD